MNNMERGIIGKEDQDILVLTGKENFSIDQVNTSYAGDMQKKDGKKRLKENRKKISKLQDKFYADGRYGLLIILQAMDASGKDSTVKHIFSRVRPQGIRFSEFQSPSDAELKHDYLWRLHKEIPERGIIGIFHRSYHEEVVVTRVHPEYILQQGLPGIHEEDEIDERFWQQRYRQINDFEQYLVENGIHVLKFFLHVSKEEQGKRFLKRMNRQDKHWKFSTNDIHERRHWDAYQKAYEQALLNTSSDFAPWFIIPADQKWYTRFIISDLIYRKLKNLEIYYPGLSVSGSEKQSLMESLNYITNY